MLVVVILLAVVVVIVAVVAVVVIAIVVAVDGDCHLRLLLWFVMVCLFVVTFL